MTEKKDIFSEGDEPFKILPKLSRRERMGVGTKKKLVKKPREVVEKKPVEFINYIEEEETKDGSDPQAGN